MAEGFVEGILGGGESEPLEIDTATAAAEPVAAAIAVDAARFDPELSRKAGDYLEEQRRLVKIQTEHLHEQRAVQLSHLKLRRFTDRLKAGTQLFFIFLATVVGIGLGVMVFDAFSARSVVVEAFDAPPALAARGVSGKVVATAVLDSLQAMREVTRSGGRGLDTHNAWSSDVKIEAPGTGVSIGEINRILRERFGHDLHIEGDLVQMADGELALTVRGDSVPAHTFIGTEPDLGKLTTQAAEYVYGRSQPLKFAGYLEDNGRNADALVYLPGAFARAANDLDRAKLANVWGNAAVAMNKSTEGVATFRLAIKLDPNFWQARANLTSAVMVAEGEEAGWREGRAFFDLVARTPKSKRPELAVLRDTAANLWDLPLALAASLDDEARHGGVGSQTNPDDTALADIYGSMHDPENAARYMAGGDPTDRDTREEAAVLPVYAAMDRGGTNWAAITPALEAFWPAWQADPNHALDQPCYLGLVYGMQGRVHEAETVFTRSVPSSTCDALHGDVLIQSGDVAGAQRVWAEGLKAGPDLPVVYLHRGLFELSHGDLAAAQADFRTANLKAPHFADPLKAWGDLLAKQGRWDGALAKYDAALKYAPAWAELRLARAIAAPRAAAVRS